MNLPRRQVLRLAIGAAALPVLARVAIAGDTEKWAKVIRAANIKPE